MTEPVRLFGEWRNVSAALGLAVLAASCTSDAGEAKPTGTPGRVPSALPVAGYSVRYRIQELDRVREERIVVRRPYESRRTSTRDEVTVSGTLVNGQGLWHWAGEPGGWQLIDVGRRRAEADARPLEALPPLIDAGLATIEGSDSVVGRRCVVVRTGEPIGSPATKAPTERDHTEFCLDRSGVMLRERWVIDGRTVRHQEATELLLDPPLDDHDFEAVPAAATKEPPLAGKQLVEVTETILDSLDVGFDLPPDIKADGAEGWLTRDPQGGVTGGSVRRFFRRGEDLAEVEERETAAVGSRRDLRYPTSLGKGFLESDLHHVTLRVPIRQEVTVIVQASSMELLRDLARRMRYHEQGTSPGLGPQREQVSP